MGGALPGSGWPAPPALVPGACHVWWGRLGDCADRHLRLLDAVERGRRERFRRQADRDRFTLGVALTRLVAGAHLGVPPERLEIDRTCRCGQPHGRPRLAGEAGLDFSISHSGGLVAFAIAITAAGAGPTVGVDVEQTGRAPDPGLPKMVLSASEQADFARVPPAGRAGAFYRYWVRKEALVKATGEGIAVPLSDLSVSAADEPPRLRAWKGRPGAVAGIALHDLVAEPGYAASLALMGKGLRVSELDASALLS